MTGEPNISMSTPLPAGQAEIRRVVLTLAWPVVAEMALQTATQIVDMAMVGRLGPVAISAVGLSFPPLFVAMGVFMGIAVGTTALVARSIGAKDRNLASSVTAQALSVAAVLAVALTGIAIWQAPRVVAFMGAEPEVVAAGASYIRALMPGAAFMLTAMILAGSLRGAGDTRTPMKVNLVINALNVGLNYVLIFGHLGFPALGLVGAALGTTIARSIGGMALVLIVARGKTIISLNPRDMLRPDPAILRRIFSIGAPAALERLVMSVGHLLYVRLVASLGTVAIAAHTITINAESLSFMPGIALSTAATTLVGQSLGARDPRRAELCARETVRLGTLVMGSMAVLFLIIPHLLMRIYTTDPAVIDLGRNILRIAALAQIPMGISFILAGALRGAGDTRTVLYISMLGAWPVRLLLTGAFLFLGWGLTGAWLAMVLDWAVRSFVTWKHFNRGRWKEIEI